MSEVCETEAHGVGVVYVACEYETEAHSVGEGEGVDLGGSGHITMRW